MSAGDITDHDSVAYSLIANQDPSDDDLQVRTRMSRSSLAPPTINTFAGRLRGSQRLAFLGVLSVFLLVIIWLLSNMDTYSTSAVIGQTNGKFSSYLESPVSQIYENGVGTPPEEQLPLKSDGSLRPSDLRTKVILQYDWYQKNCYDESAGQLLSRSIQDIYKKLQLLKESQEEDCQLIWNIFDSMFRIEAISAPIVLPKPFQKEVKGWLDNDEKLFQQVNEQVVFKIVSRGTFEETVFNPLRAKRPVSKPSMDPLEYIKNLTESSAPNCDFCKYKDHTAADTFGRIDNDYSASCSNTFKLAKFHGLFFPKEHHPLNLSLVQLQSLFLYTSKQWFQKAFETDSSQKYPSLMWDALPHAGASQVHPHIHGVLDAYQYVGGFESWHQVSIQYFKKYQRSFWSDFVQLHVALGLSISHGEAIALVPIVARKDHEFMILSTNLNEDVVSLIYNVMQAYLHKLGVYCFSSGAVYPKVGGGEGDTGMPVIFRIGSRGTCTSVGSDVSSLELYTINNINSDLAKTYNGLVEQVNSGETKK
ncbi:unnamed protein product [Orchesella dallaii]|uniref:Uncharacterized protein n=1 Tax=Orchesella dallaii TaxID=48710 RepID=A0ABP1S6S3_9HEXA